MSTRTRSTTTAGACRYCNTRSFRRDDEGPVHDCCLAWRRVMAAGYPCPACQIAQIFTRTGRLPASPPPLPVTLPDGTPYAPEQPDPPDPRS